MKLIDQKLSKIGLNSYQGKNPFINQKIDWSKQYSLKKESENIFLELKNLSIEQIIQSYSNSTKRFIRFIEVG